MLAQVIRQERFGEPMQAFKIEEIATPADLRPDEVLVWVMAAGINYNNVWAGLGSPVDVIKAHQRDKDWPDDSPFHIGGSDASGIVWKVGSAVTNVKVGDQRGDPLRHVEGRRPVGEGGHRSDVQPDLPHLGLRDQLGQLRAVHPRAGAPVPAEARAPLLGRRGGLHAGRRHRLPHADELAAAHGADGRRRAGLGRRRRPRLPGHPDRARRGRHPDRRHLERRQDRLLQEARREGHHQPQAVLPLGHAAALEGRRGLRRVAEGRARASARRSGRRSASAAARASCSSIPARTPCRPRSSSATPAAWW